MRKPAYTFNIIQEGGVPSAKAKGCTLGYWTRRGLQELPVTQAGRALSWHLLRMHRSTVEASGVEVLVEHDAADMLMQRKDMRDSGADSDSAPMT